MTLILLPKSRSKTYHDSEGKTVLNWGALELSLGESSFLIFDFSKIKYWTSDTKKESKRLKNGELIDKMKQTNQNK